MEMILQTQAFLHDTEFDASLCVITLMLDFIKSQRPIHQAS
jgi:hypothetical protein